MNRDIFKIVVVLAILIGLLMAKFVLFPSTNSGADGPPPATQEAITDPGPSDLRSDQSLNDGEPIDLRPADSGLRGEMRTILMEQALMRTVAEKYPADFEHFLDQLLKAFDAPNPEQAAFEIGRTFTTKLRHANVEHAVNTPGVSLKAVFDNHIEILNQLKETHGLEACGAFAQLGVDAPELASWKISDQVQENARLTLLSLANARDNPHPHGDITKDDVALLTQAMQELGSAPEKIDVYLNGSQSSPAEDCEATINMINGFSKLPAEAAGRLMAARFSAMIAS